jgi:hypothetical protein
VVALEVVGQIDIEPPLDGEGRAAFEILTRPSGYDEPGRPQSDCGWEVCPGGCCLRLTGADDLDDARAWLRYGVHTLAEDGGRVLSGMVVARQPDGEIFTLKVTRQHRIYERVLRVGRRRRRPPTVAPVIDLSERRRRR